MRELTLEEYELISGGVSSDTSGVDLPIIPLDPITVTGTYDPGQGLSIGDAGLIGGLIGGGVAASSYIAGGSAASFASLGDAIAFGTLAGGVTCPHSSVPV